MPGNVRDSIYEIPWIYRAKTRIVRSTVKHDDIYDSQYFMDRDRAASDSSAKMAASIVSRFNPQLVLDVGCGAGNLLAALKPYGVPGIGLEYSEAALSMCQLRDIVAYKYFIGEEPVPDMPTNFDLVVSFEVAEHLDPEIADFYVRLLCSRSDRVLLTAATPGQGGTDHVNEQPNDYWIEKFSQFGFQFIDEVSASMREAWEKENIAWWYSRNLMVFEKEC